MNRSASAAKATASAAFATAPADGSQVIRRHSRSFGLASTLLPGRVREDVRTLYAWCRWCDEAVDAAADQSQAARQLATLRDDVRRIYAGEVPSHRASIWLAEIVGRHGIPEEYPRGLITAMETDITLTQLETDQQLLEYCHNAAGVVGLMLCRVFGVGDRRAERHAASLGIAMQLTNIARDVREDRERGRCYLPAAWFRGKEADDGEVRCVVKRLLRLADEHYEIGFDGLNYLPADTRPAVRVAGSVYREIGEEIRRRDYRVLSGRTVVPVRRILFLMVTGWFRERFSAAFRSGPRVALARARRRRSRLETQGISMNDAKHVCYLGISLTAFLGSALFLFVYLNPKNSAYALTPVVYAVVCGVVGLVANRMAKRAEQGRGPTS